MDEWEEASWLGHQPAKEVVMIQCAGSRDRRRLPYCSRICCMIALKHAMRLRTLFPEMKVTICYLELRAAGVGYENWFLAARRAGVEFLRGTPLEVQFDGDGKPVIEVEDVTAAEKRMLRPDLVVLSTGMVPTTDTGRIAGVLDVDLDEDGFIADSRPQEPGHRDERRGRFRLRLGGRAEGAGGVQHRGLGGRQRDSQLPLLGRAHDCSPPPWWTRPSASAATAA